MVEAFGKSICSICYEDLKPILEDLQAISICGHVFHEICLQQWFEYCSNTKKYTCPVCKQSCKTKDAGRLYFQSMVDAVDTNVSLQLFNDRHENPEVLRREVKKLEAKVLELGSALERQGKNLKELNEQLYLCQEQAKNEIALKNEALKQKASLQQLLLCETEELVKSNLVCTQLQEKNMELAKELATVKLVSNLDMDEDEVLKLASFGTGSCNKDTIGTLSRSLLLRNRSYKELMTKCNILGQGEARYSRKLEKAKNKIYKYKKRIKELEIAVEEKENDALRALKGSKKARSEGIIQDGVNCKYSSSVNNKSSEDQRKQLFASVRLDTTKNSVYDHSWPSRSEKSNLTSSTDMDDANDGMRASKEISACSLANKDASNFSASMHQILSSDAKHATTNNVATHNHTVLKSNKTSNTRTETSSTESCDLVGSLNSVMSIDHSSRSFAASNDKDVILIPDDVTEVQPAFNTRKESSVSGPLSSPGDLCFSGGLLGPDGSSRYLGKWCKRSQNKDSSQGLSTDYGNVISVGADGRGGRDKVLRSLNQSSLNSEVSAGIKKFKYGTKTSSGCPQIDQFYVRVDK